MKDIVVVRLNRWLAGAFLQACLGTGLLQRSATEHGGSDTVEQRCLV